MWAHLYCNVSHVEIAIEELLHVFFCSSSAPASTAIEQACFNFIIRLKLATIGFPSRSTVVKYEIARHAMLLLRLRGSLDV
jgi:hypothetical protein